MLLLFLFEVAEGAFAHLETHVQTITLFSQFAQTLLQLGDFSGPMLSVRLELRKS